MGGSKATCAPDNVETQPIPVMELDPNTLRTPPPAKVLSISPDTARAMYQKKPAPDTKSQDEDLCKGEQQPVKSVAESGKGKEV